MVLLRIIKQHTWPAITLFSLVTACFLMLDDWMQQLYTPNNKAEFELRYFMVLWLFSLSLWLVGSRLLTFSVFFLFAGMQIIQLSHVSFFGEPLTPPDILNLVRDFPDVKESAFDSFADHWLVIPSVLLPYSLAAIMFYVFRPVLAISHHYWALLVIVLVLAAKPYRASYRGMDDFMPSASRSGLHNSMNAFGYIATNHDTSSNLIEVDQHKRQPYQIQQVASGVRNVWIVIPDSLRTDRLGVYGYHRNTTPFLSELYDQGKLLRKEGIAAGVTTAVSLSNLLNMVSQPGQMHFLDEQTYNLFSFAKSSGFKTFWFSSQESKLLAHAGTRFIDVSITREDHPLKFLKRHDHAIPELMREHKWGEKNFAIINLRSAHLPYEKNYRQHDEDIAMWPDDASLTKDERMNNAYDNAIRYMDDVIRDLVNEFDKLEGESYLIITSDHGQLLGEEGRWGHNDLHPKIIEVPVMIYSKNADTSLLDKINCWDHVSHYDVASWVAELLGYQVHNPNLAADSRYNLGNQVYVDGYVQKIKMRGDKLHYEPPELHSSWISRHLNSAQHQLATE